MKRLAAAIGLLLLSQPLAAAQGSAQDKVSPETIARVVKLLEGSGYRYTKAAEEVWSIDFKGEQRSSIRVLIIAYEQQLHIDGVIALKAEVADDPETLKQLLIMNRSVDNATVLIDGDNDYVARYWFSLKNADVKSFKESVEAIALAADQSYGAIKARLVGQSRSSATGTPGASGTPPPPAAAAPAPPSAGREVSLLNGKASLTFDGAKWRETKAEESNVHTFEHIQGDGYAKIIAERIQVPLDQLRQLAITNMEKAATDVKIASEDRRRVNGADIMVIRFDVISNGVPFSFLGHYWSGPAGTVQVITFTGRNLFEEYLPDFEAFLNGLRTAPSS